MDETLLPENSCSGAAKQSVTNLNIGAKLPNLAAFAYASPEIV